jgi:general secretion pathway protein A
VYTQFYGLTEAPFNLTPDPKYLFFSGRHREAYNHLLYGIQQRKGFIQLTGEVGSGKTTLCRALLNELGERYVTALVLNPMFSESQMLRVVVREFGVGVPARDRLRNYELLNEFLLAKVKENRDAVLILDESQDLTSGLLEQVRLLSNLETDNRKLIQIVLLGQPELRAKLNLPELRQLRQRITVRFHLGPLSEEETRGYIEHRLAVAGAKERPVFDPAAIAAVHRYAKGTPRLISALADKALLAGYVHQTDHITARLVELGIDELEGCSA